MPGWSRYAQGTPNQPTQKPAQNKHVTHVILKWLPKPTSNAQDAPRELDTSTTRVANISNDGGQAKPTTSTPLLGECFHLPKL
eukprot:12920594-Prorocentrum_lima.AAC.1